MTEVLPPFSISLVVLENSASRDDMLNNESWMDDKYFGNAAFEVLSKAIYESIPPESECA